MPPTVFPDASNGPLNLGPGQASGPLSFPETAGGGPPPAVFLRVVMLGAGCEPPGLPRPRFTLQAGTGTPVELPDPEFGRVFVRDDPGAASAPVARAKLFIEGENVYAIQILIDRAGSAWKLRMTNTHDTERRFTWVVADNEPESKQPWLNLPQTLSFNAKAGATARNSVDVPNLGTGNLTISLGGLAAGSRFRLDQLPEDVAPNDCGKLIVSFDAPGAAGTTEEEYTAVSNDKQATESAHHNNRIRLTAKTTTPDTGGGNGPGNGPPEGGRCRKCPCPRFFGTSSHPVLGRKCQTFNCGHDIAEHLPPQ
jgi:hypothetical protein